MKDAKFLLTTPYHCMDCKNAYDIWLLGDDELKCKKINKKVNMNFICPKFAKIDDGEIFHRWRYHDKYKTDGEWIRNVASVHRALKETR